MRAQLSSAQLPTYFVGVQEHLALREEAKQRWGAQFSLKRYHDQVLSYGSPPVRYVRELIFDLPIASAQDGELRACRARFAHVLEDAGAVLFDGRQPALAPTRIPARGCRGRRGSR